MKSIKITKLSDGAIFKRSEKSRVWFKVITKTDYGVVITSMTAGSEYSALMKNKSIVYVKK